MTLTRREKGAISLDVSSVSITLPKPDMSTPARPLILSGYLWPMGQLAANARILELENGRG